MKEIKRETFRLSQEGFCDNDNMFRVVLDMTKREYVLYIKPMLETVQDINCKTLDKNK